MAREKMNIEELSDEELEAYLSSSDERTGVRATEHQLAGGAPRGFSLLMVVVGVLGMLSAVELLRSEKQLLEDPAASLTCDLNPLIGCGKFLTSSQNELFFGLSNSVFGLAFFTGIFALGLVLVSGGRMARWLWIALDLLMVGATVWLVWFQWTALTVERSLCPYCMVVWVATIPLIINTWARSAQAGHVRLPAALTNALVRGRWYLVALVYIALVAIVVVAFWDQWSLVF